MEIAAILLMTLPILAFAGYPAVLLAAARIAPRRRRMPEAVDLPVVVVICAYNEGPRIGAKLASVVAALASWRGHGRIVVADDGSSDDTASVAGSFPGVELIRLPRGGKAAALNRVAPRHGDAILVMTDADPLFDEGTIPALLAPFAEPPVGAVGGRVLPCAMPGGAGFDRLFRAYESAVRQAESDLFGCVSADGGLYAIRAALMPVVPADVTDDFFVSTAVVAAGRRIVFAEGARAWEESIVGGRRNLSRRIRITVRGLTALWSRRALMNPLRTGWYAPALIFHKVARRLSPLALPPLWILSALLAVTGSAFWALVFAGMTAIALAGVISLLAPQRLPRLFAPVYGVALHLAGLTVGAILFASGRRYAQWTPQKGSA